MSVTAEMMNVTASIASATPGVKTATMTPASAGPRNPAALSSAVLSELAAGSCSSLTTSGRIAYDGARNSPSSAPRTAVSAIKGTNESSDVSASPATASTQNPRPTSVRSISLDLSMRSASTPPIGTVMIRARPKHIRTRPSSRTPAWPKIRNGRAMT